MAGTLFVVATPIGHLEDITVRALRVLQEVALVAAEDTRRSGNLLRHFGIGTRLVSLHAHNERSRSPQIVARLQQGESVALVSDAGTPGISDPGAELVRLARAQGVRVEAVPGASAVSSAMSASGLDTQAFVFMGFAPIRSQARKKWFEMFARFHPDAAIVCFEAPHRLRKTLTDLSVYVDRPILVFRELTKLYEQTLEGTVAELLAALPQPQGEFTLVIPPRPPSNDAPGEISLEILQNELGESMEQGATSRRDAARAVAAKFGLSTKFVYDATKGND
jgi:16S rRNA (cytidine1402-2'-O)-methyltransferase